VTFRPKLIKSDKRSWREILTPLQIAIPSIPPELNKLPPHQVRGVILSSRLKALPEEGILILDVWDRLSAIMNSWILQYVSSNGQRTVYIPMEVGATLFCDNFVPENEYNFVTTDLTRAAEFHKLWDETPVDWVTIIKENIRDSKFT
jgi:hypothetical protein